MKSEKSHAFVFLSSTFYDLMEERKAVEEQLKRLTQTFIGMEYFPATSEPPKNAALQQLSGTDIVIFVIAHKYGTVDKRTKKSIVELEYTMAWKHRKHILIYFKDDQVPILPMYMEQNQDLAKKLMKFKKTLKNRHSVTKFRDPNHLAALVSSDLVNILYRGFLWRGITTEQLRMYKSFWKDFNDGLSIVIEAGHEYHAHKGELEIAKNINGVYGLLTIIPALEEIGVPFTIVNSLDPYLNKDCHLLLDGSYGGNKLTAEIERHPDIKQILQIRNVYSEDKYTRWIEEIDGKRKLFSTRYEKADPLYLGGPKKKIAYDYGILSRLPNPFSPSRRCIICSGNHGAGTYGCMKFLSTPHLLVRLINAVGNVSFQAVIAIRPIDFYEFREPELIEIRALTS